MRWFGEYEKYSLLLLVSSMLHLLLHCPQSVTNALREYASCHSIVMHKGYVAASVWGGKRRWRRRGDCIWNAGLWIEFERQSMSSRLPHPILSPLGRGMRIAPPPGNASAKDAQFAVQSLDTCIGAQLCTHDDLS